MSSARSLRGPATYAVVTRHGAPPDRSGLSHAEAMRLAEELRRGGDVVSVMHMTEDSSCEVDRYPAR
jgi:hypothetical protein